MAAIVFGPAVPFGFDSGLDDFNEEYQWERKAQTMTSDTSFQRMLDGNDADSHYATHSLLAPSDMAKSPDRSSQQNASTTDASNSHSPNTSSFVLTPASTNLDFTLSGGLSSFEQPDESDVISTGGRSHTSPYSEDYVHIDRHFIGEPSFRMDANDQNQATSRSVAHDIHAYQTSAPLDSLFPSMAGSQFSVNNLAELSRNANTAYEQGAQFGNLSLAGNYSSSDEGFGRSSMGFEEDPPPHLNAFAPTTENPFDTQMGIASSSNPSFGSTFSIQTPSLQQMPARAHDRANVGHIGAAQSAYPEFPQQVLPQALPGQPGHPVYQGAPCTMDYNYLEQQYQVAASSLQSRLPETSHDQTQPSPAPVHSLQAPRYSSESEEQYSSPTKYASRKLKPAVSGTHAPAHPSQSKRGHPRGGREKGKRLAPKTRHESSEMRKKGACWRCVMQRDKCSEGMPCKRCVENDLKGVSMYFPCDRSKLPDLVFDFLPPSMTWMHQKQTIEDCVKDQVLEWDLQNSRDVYLTCGYGPALPWKLYEFKPRTNELTGQFQYLQDPTTGTTVRQQKYAPPFGLTKLDTSDDRHFDTYLELLLRREYLWDFGWTCFEEETQIDDFQARLLELVCKLYTNAQDYDLRELLRKIIKMMLITYIMGHALTIEENTAWGVVSSIRHSPRPDRIPPHTSPKLANRQLKFFFCILRNKVYGDILNWQQQTLHSSGKKEETWLSAFCVMLGFAMVLEEVQRTIYLQADAKAMKGEVPRAQADFEAYNACERIDKRFDLLVGLFQCKYRDKKWSTGSFGRQTPELYYLHQRKFCEKLLGLLWEKKEHLESRRDVPLSFETQCRFTSRLVARFLLPFLGLPE
ncbi:hypothetical protein D0869_05828 [Hortaea werneckii]|uniref:Zn(2)-C6 fungal-type domain-containing protein n=1 Tax=Hortaea werneckii TaxID=91943 RepID=A0A3M6WVW9_HORWE|nr:hypothetical protein D0869_05828 [Hortaea werneckii]RMY06937.1 hypothetical protein D0868_05606 [Hortaea werneckii]